MSVGLASTPESPAADFDQSPDRAGPLRVLHVINGEDYSGAERVQDLLASRLAEHGVTVGFACVKPGRFAAARRSQQAPLHDVPMHFRCDLSPIWRLARLIRDGKYDLVHTHSARNVLVGGPAARLAGVPLVHHVHVQTSTEVRRRWLSRLNSVLEKITTRNAAAVIAVSESCRNYLLDRGYPAQRVWLVPNGVPLEAPSRCRREGSLRTVAVVAMFRPRKGIEVLLEAVALLRAQGLPVRLRAVGRFQSADYERSILDLERTLGLTGAIDWVGFKQDVAAELAKSDVFVLPSLIAEAMPMSVLEAMASGVPIVGTRVAGTTDLIRDGRDGLLAEPGSALDLADKIGRLVRGDVDSAMICANAKERQQARFSDSAMAAGVVQVYRAVLARACNDLTQTQTNKVLS